MTFSIQPALKDDLRRLVEIFHEAFVGELFSIIYGNCDPKELTKRGLEVYEKEFEAPGRRYFKVVDSENGEIVAFSKWWYPHTLTPEQAAAKTESDKIPRTYAEGAVRELCEPFIEALAAKRKIYINAETDYFVHLLAVRPSYQRRGLGGMLLADGLKLADRDGARTYIEATDKGEGLYLKLGWKEIDEIAVDTRPFGGKGVDVTKCMMREPRAVEL